MRKSIKVCILSVIYIATGGSLSHGQDDVLGGVDLGGGWFFSEWYGYYNASYHPWIFHNEHGFQFLSEAEPGGDLYLFDLALSDWWFTTETIYPAFYAFGLQTWSYYFEETKDPREFVDLETEAFWSWGKLIIEVSGEWGGTRLSEIEIALLDTASHINGLLRSPWLGQINVIPSDLGHPRILYRSSRTDPVVILLSANGESWQQFSYQFAHEFAHILSNYEDLRNNPNNWFHETICELASMFILRLQAESWAMNPPIESLRWWFPEIIKEDFLSYTQLLWNDRAQLPEGTTLPEWIESEESSLRSDAVQRDKNGLVAYSLLSLFEEQPSGWNTIRLLPNSSAELGGYLSEWAEAVHPDDVQFVIDLAEILGHGISSDSN